MNGIDFHEENEYRVRANNHLGRSDSPKMYRFLVDKKIVSNEKQAQYLSLVVSVFSLMLAYFLYSHLIKVPKFDYVISRDGQKIETEEYINMLGRGEDPLN